MNKKTFVGGTIAALFGAVLIAVFLLYSSPAPAGPPIVSWMPPSVVQDVVAGESVTTTASFTATRNLSGVVVRVVPEIAPYVTVSPTAFSSITKGSTYTLNVTLTTPADALPTSTDGTIQLRSGSDQNNTYAKPLPVKLNVVWPTFDGGTDLSGVSFSYPAFGAKLLCPSYQ